MKTREAILAALCVLSMSSSVLAEATPVTVGEMNLITSKILKEERPYLVYLPSSYGEKSRSYPVLYLLDGDAFFHSATGIVSAMSSGVADNYQIPELIVVAIPNTDRTRDLTPTHDSEVDGQTIADFATSGGGDEFLSFLRNELFPRIESTYRTKPCRILVGHSLGGLLALHALQTSPDMFSGYIAIDPSLWWDDSLLVKQAAASVVKSKPSGSVYISLAHEPDIGMGDPTEPRKLGETLFAVLTAVPELQADLAYFENEDHGSVPTLSLYHGLLHVFEGYKIPLETLVLRPETISPMYKQLSARLGVPFLPSEDLLNEVAYGGLAMGKVDKAIELFAINVENYPRSWNAHDSLGEAYMVKGETALAIENYERSLELNPDNENATEKLTELDKQASPSVQEEN